MSKIFIISDTHFGHSAIIKLCNRPFKDKDEMDNTMINNWNSVVGFDDIVIHLGDFMYYKQDTGIFEKLKGHKILIKGNHDHSVTKNMNWQSVHDYLEINQFINGSIKNFILFHYPIFEWNKKFHGSIHLYGHIHNNVMNEKNAYNVCVEHTNYTPQSLDIFNKIEIKEKEKE